MEVIVEEIKDADVEAVIALWHACGLTRPWNDPCNDIAFARSKSNSTILVARDDTEGAIVASVMVGHDGHRGWFYYLSVDPARQQGGLGRHLMGAAEKWLLDQGIWKAQLMVRTGNEGVIRFYQTLGYNNCETQTLEKWIDPSKRGDA